MYPEWRKRRFFELHLAWLVQGPKGYDLLFKINPYSLYATREEALEAARALVEKGRLDQDERVGRNKAPVLLSEEDKARFLLLLERGKALLPLDRYALLGEVAEVEERLLFRAPFADPKNALKSPRKRVRLHATPSTTPRRKAPSSPRGPWPWTGRIAVGSFRLSVPGNPHRGPRPGGGLLRPGETRYYLYSPRPPKASSRKAPPGKGARRPGPPPPGRGGLG